MTQKNHLLSLVVATLSTFLFSGHSALAQLSKGNRIIISNGLQVQGMVTKDDVFHLGTYESANYTSINWLWESNPSLMGGAPGVLWSRWIGSETNAIPTPDEAPYMSNLLTLQLGDEWALKEIANRDRAVAWFDAIRINYPDTILYMNNFGGQVPDAELADFVSRAKPDMICFDTYPWKSDYTTRIPYAGQPTSWYSELRRYRDHARGANIPFATYVQMFHAVQDYDQTVYRDPSPSELRLNHSAALAFNAKLLIDFTYNTGASSLFTTPGGDSNPTPLFTDKANANLRARNLGKALVRLKPADEMHNPATQNPPPGPISGNPNFPEGITTSVMFLKGTPGTTNATPLPINFINDPEAPNSYSWWESAKNDPYLNGWVVTNKGGIFNDGKPGEVIISWFKPLDETFDGPNYTNQIYMMVVNALVSTNGTATDCQQEIKLNFVFGSSGITRVVMLDPLTGQLQTNTVPQLPPPNASRRQLVLTLNGGDAVLFKFDTGAPFVGFHPTQPARMNIKKLGDGAQIDIQGTVAGRYRVESSPTLPATNWTTVTNLFLSSSPYSFPDPSLSSGGNTFYRAAVLPDN